MKTKTLLALSTALGAMTPAERSMGRYMRAPDEHPDPAPAADAGGDAFADAFAAAAADETPPAETPPAETPPAETPPAETLPAETPPAETPPAETPPAETPAPTATDIVAQLAEALKNQPAPAAAQPAAQPAEQPADQAPLYSAQEIEVLSEYEKNWPDVAQAESLKRRAEYADLITFVFKQVRDYVQPHLEQISALGNIAHEQQLRAAVPDYTPDLETQVANWIETEPAYLQAGMKQVMQSGTSDEVADLIQRYKSATGAQQASTPAATAAATTPKAPTPAAKTELSSAAKQAAESLAPVSGDRSAVPQGEDSGDYDSAFKKFAATGAV